MVGVAGVGSVWVSRGVGDATSSGLSLVEGIGAVTVSLQETCNRAHLKVDGCCYI